MTVVSAPSWMMGGRVWWQVYRTWREQLVRVGHPCEPSEPDAPLAARSLQEYCSCYAG